MRSNSSGLTFLINDEMLAPELEPQNVPGEARSPHRLPDQAGQGTFDSLAQFHRGYDA
jgi:hypothetical protein